MAGFARSPRKIGFEKEFVKECNHLFTNEKVGLSDAKLPRVARNLEMIRPFVSVENLTDKPALGLTENHRHKARTFIHEKFGDSRPLVAIHQGTSRNLKKWPLHSFSSLCDMLAESLGAKVMLTWGPGELDDAENIRSMAKSSPEVGMRTESLLELAALFEACDLTVTVDSGPMHIGSAVGTPLVAIFGPTDIQVNAPYWQPNKVLSGGLECSPCDEKCDSARCMDAVKPEDVAKAVRELLAKAGTDSPGHKPVDD
jgi:ADP-heptose:LPS heptosyltransferase